jgi:dTDP-4-amino-4,6-dideoxygalactose transaminase
MTREVVEIKPEIDRAIQGVLESGWFVLGEQGKAFEAEFAAYCGVRFCVGCASGTEALALALMALGIGAGDEVVTTDLSAVPTLSAISMTGAKPVMVDVEEETCLLDAGLVEARITPKTKALMPVHLYGQPCDLEALQRLAQKYGLPLVEDACQAHGSEYQGKKTGSLGTLAAFSFYPSKNLGCYGDGGAVTTDSEELYEKLTKLRNYGQSRRYYHDSIGINSRLDEIQAAVLRVKLKHLDAWTRRRHEIAARYNALITNPRVTKPGIRPGRKTNYHLYVVKVEGRDRVQEQLAQAGVQTLIHYPVPMHRQKAYAQLGYAPAEFPVTGRCTERILSLPMYPQLTDAEVEYACAQINRL